jgi:hypothetical protein
VSVPLIHYKGNLYRVIRDSVRHSETVEAMVHYRALYDSPEFGRNAYWVRPQAMFLENVVVDGVSLPRFKYIARTFSEAKKKIKSKR